MLNLKKEIDQWGPIDGKVLYPSFWFYGMSRVLSVGLRTPWPTYIGVYDHDRMAYYWEKDQMQKRGEAALKTWILRDKNRKKLWADTLRIRNRMQRVVLGANPEDYFKCLVDFWTVTAIPELANFAAPGYLRKKLVHLVPAEQLNEVIGTLIAPEKLSFLQRSELELLEAKSIERYARKWYWVENSYYEDKFLSVDYFRSQLKKYSKAQLKAKFKQLKNYPKEILKRKEQLFKKYHLSKEIVYIAKQTSFSIWWQDYRKATTWWFHSYIDRLSEKIVKRFGIDHDDLMHYTAEEWLKLTQSGKKVSQSILKERKKIFMVTVTARGYHLDYEHKPRRILKQLNKLHDVGQSTVLRGIVAHRSKKGVRGRVRVLHSPRFAHQMKEGEILVAPMTSPDFIVAMRKAKAIITDVGGLMSHAAVVSRELGVPCIVATKIATKIFKDGDLVEVDANKGIVRKVK